jgi:hypothetical protein
MSSNLNSPGAALARSLTVLASLSRGAATCCLGVTLVMACATRQGGSDSANGDVASAAMTEQQPNTLSDAERRAGWRLLFDGTSLSNWRQYQGDSVPAAWRVENGLITKNVGTRDIVTREQFGDFELTFDWRVSTGGNAGVFYRATEEYDHVYWSAPEYQLLDDPNARDGRVANTSAGAAYALYDAPRGAVKPAGEWNTGRILVRGNHVEHWLNETKMADYEIASPDWEARVKGSKFKDWPNYARAKRGFIALQGDHGGDLALRNIKIRELK